MQSLPNERDPGATYRIARHKMPAPCRDMYSIAVFGGVFGEYEDKLYRFDLLPQWMQDAVAVLDTAGSGIGVLGLGRKIGGSYWIGAGLDTGDLDKIDYLTRG